jgi:hypothetical protein
MYWIQRTSRAEGDYWQREADEQFDSLTDAFERRDELIASRDACAVSTLHVQFRVVDADGNVLDYERKMV